MDNKNYLTLYKYKSLDNLAFFLDIIVRNRLYGATMKELNDPMEGYFDSLNFSNSEWERIHKVKNSVRICSLSKNKNNALLWAHYANQHKGCCVEVEIPNNISWEYIDVKYKSVPPQLSPSLSEEDAIKFLYSTKSDYWSYEDEVRYIKKVKQSKDNKPYKAHLSIKVKKIYLGIRVTTEEKKNIERIVKAIDSNIVVEKMKRQDILFWKKQLVSHVQNIKMECPYKHICSFVDTKECLNILNGCLKIYLNKGES